MIVMKNVFNVLIIIFLLRKVINVYKFAKVFNKVFLFKKRLFSNILILCKDTYGDNETK